MKTKTTSTFRVRFAAAAVVGILALGFSSSTPAAEPAKPEVAGSYVLRFALRPLVTMDGAGGNLFNTHDEIKVFTKEIKDGARWVRFPSKKRDPDVYDRGAGKALTIRVATRELLPGQKHRFEVKAVEQDPGIDRTIYKAVVHVSRSAEGKLSIKVTDRWGKELNGKFDTPVNWVTVQHGVTGTYNHKWKYRVRFTAKPRS